MAKANSMARLLSLLAARDAYPIQPPASMDREINVAATDVKERVLEYTLYLALKYEFGV